MKIYIKSIFCSLYMLLFVGNVNSTIDTPLKGIDVTEEKSPDTEGSTIIYYLKK